MCNVVYMFQRDSKVNVNYAGALFTIPRKRYFVCVCLGMGWGGVITFICTTAPTSCYAVDGSGYEVGVDRCDETSESFGSPWLHHLDHSRRCKVLQSLS